MKVTDKTLILRIFREPILLICVDKYISSFLCLSTYYWILKLNIENINILVFWHLFHCHGLKRWYLSRPPLTPVHILACSQIETLRTISAVQIRYFLSTLAWQMFFVFVWFLQHFCSLAFHLHRRHTTLAWGTDSEWLHHRHLKPSKTCFYLQHFRTFLHFLHFLE